MVKQMNSIDLAYFAGLFDGEGCIQILHYKPQTGKRTEQHTLSCKVNMTNKESVEQFLAFGGSMCQHKASQKNPTWKDQWIWTVNSNKAVSFLKTLLPFLKLKRAEAQVGIEFQTTRRACAYGGKRFRSAISPMELRRREWYRQELRRLKDSRFPQRSWYNDERKRAVLAGNRRTYKN